MYRPLTVNDITKLDSDNMFLSWASMFVWKKSQFSSVNSVFASLKKKKAKQVKQHIDGDLCEVLIGADGAFLGVNKRAEGGS